MIKDFGEHKFIPLTTYNFHDKVYTRYFRHPSWEI